MFDLHLHAAIDKAWHVIDYLSKLMPNVKGLNENKRLLLVSIVQSVLLYGALM